MRQRITHFLRQYRNFSFGAIGALVGASLDLANYDLASHWVLGTVAIVACLPLLVDMFRTLKTGHFGIDILAIIAIVTAVLLGQYWAAIIVVLMLTGGESLEDYAERRAKNELTHLLANRPQVAHLVRGRKTEDVKVSAVNVGDKLTILPGELVPVDATIIEGSTSVNEASITGESLPLAKHVGDQLVSGSVNIDGAITVKAMHTAANSQYEQIIKLVRGATSGQSPFVRLADRYSVPFTVLSLMIAGAAWFVSRDVNRFLEVLVVATPCPLLLGAPIAIVSGMSRASKHGIIIKNGTSLEQLAQVKTVGFDKTGTLTQGTPVVDKIAALNGFTDAQVLQAAAALEQNSTHVLARAITAHAQSEGLKYQTAKQVTEIAGHGLRGRLQGKDIMAGHLSLLLDAGIDVPTKVSSKFAKTVTYVAVDGQLAGTITFVDQVRADAKGMLGRLKQAGVQRFALVTGDNEAAAIAVAKELHITDVYPDCLPAQKMQAIEELVRPVAFVGDGVNDAPVLTVSDVGIALGARSSTAASESADVVIMLDDISRVASAVEIAKRTLSIAKQSVLIGILISIGLMAMFATGKFTAVQGALIQELVDVIVIINALRAHGAAKPVATGDSVT